MLFYVSFVDNNGKKNSNMFEAKAYEELLNKLQKNQLITLDIKPIPPYLEKIIPKGGKKISTDEIIEMIENLHLIIKAGLPLYQGIVDLAEDSNNKRFKSMLFGVAEDIRNGKALSAAFEPYKEVVTPMVLNLIKIGEETGQLESTLLRGAIFLKKVSDLRKKAKSALIYPSFAFFAIMGAMLVWMIYVLPQMTQLFKDMNIELPAMTVFIMSISDFLANYIHFVLLGIIAIGVAFKLAHKKNQRVRFFVDKVMLKIPVIKQIISSFNIAFISEYLKLAIISGIPIFNALESLGKNIKNELFQKALRDAREDLSKGSQLSSAFVKTKMFTPFVIRMMGVGESSGTLDNQLELISEHYYEKVDNYANNIGKIIEPVVLIIVGGFMALIMAGLMGPMYDLVAGMEK